jgi:hypothetical protein
LFILAGLWKKEACVLPYLTIALAVVLAVSSVSPARAGNNDFSTQVKKPVAEAIESRQATQKTEEKWRQDRLKLVAVYEQMQQKQKQMQARKDQLERRIAAAQERIASKEKQLEDIERISTQMTPFLQELVGRLQQLVSGDTPFLAAEREQRIARLAGLMEDPEVSVSEKLRKAMEALLVEAEYGSTIEVYQQTIAVDDGPSLVNVFRLGRINLFYQTLDRKRCGFYDVAAAAWRPLPADFNRPIQTAIEIGSKRRPMELLTLPLGRMAGR